MILKTKGNVSTEMILKNNEFKFKISLLTSLFLFIIIFFITCIDCIAWFQVSLPQIIKKNFKLR